VLPNTRYQRTVQPSGRLREIFGSRVICIYQGLIAARRNMEELIDAMVEVPDSIGLAIIGSGEAADVEACDRRIEQKGLAGRVQRIPPVSIEEILEWTADADIGLLLYDQSHSLNNRLCAPNKLFEYMMIGLPMIGTRCPGLEPFVAGMNLGELVDSSNSSAIAAAIVRLGEQAARRKEIGHRGRTLFESEWSYEKQVEPVLDYLERKLKS
jgi:glycosyltransferase involved in cell wall biosynthesis